MLVILLSTHLYANTRSQLDYIARGLKYAKLWCLSGDRDPNPALHYVRVKERIYQAGASWVAWIKQRGAATRSTGYTQRERHAPHGNDKSDRKTFGHLADSEGVDPRALSGSETSAPSPDSDPTPLDSTHHHPSPQIWSNGPPRTNSSIKIAFGTGSARNAIIIASSPITRVGTPDHQTKSLPSRKITLWPGPSVLYELFTTLTAKGPTQNWTPRPLLSPLNPPSRSGQYSILIRFSGTSRIYRVRREKEQSSTPGVHMRLSGVVRVPWEWYFRVELANCSTGADLSIKNKSTTLPNGLPVRGSPPKKRNRIRIATRMLWGRQRGVLSGKGARNLFLQYALAQNGREKKKPRNTTSAKECGTRYSTRLVLEVKCLVYDVHGRGERGETQCAASALHVQLVCQEGFKALSHHLSLWASWSSVVPLNDLRFTSNSKPTQFAKTYGSLRREPSDVPPDVAPRKHRLKSPFSEKILQMALSWSKAEVIGVPWWAWLLVSGRLEFRKRPVWGPLTVQVSGFAVRNQETVSISRFNVVPAACFELN
ncbi:hypothetical protein DFH94DRAFT_678215 [Russula ochroleuca]|uniref:Uncharacterized protein n=1 Tax=Russula ochroleuca TaxID=152965 RepID=A0A9P5N5N0_9AGAM|nr:hypothetical protein DFH94DRAFT_678215 [Russula ochroleuca]